MAQDASILTHLKYGDQCTFEDIDSSGFVSVTGAISIPAPGYCHDYKKLDERKLPNAFEVQVEALKKTVAMPRNLGLCVFEVLPKQQYAAHKAFTKELAKFNQQRETWRGASEHERLASSSGAIFGLDPQGRSAPVQQAAQSSLALREAAEKAEQSHNRVEYAQSVGIAVLFGQVVQLYHPGTNSFVTLKNARATLERNHMRVVAQVGGDEGSWFLIQPAYKTKVDGEKVAFRDIITFSSVKFPGVSLRVSDLADLTAQKTNTAYVKSIHEVCGSKNPTALKVLPYALHDSLIPRSSLVLHGGQTIMLRHRALGCCLSYEDGRVVFQPEQKNPHGELPSSNLLWKVEGDAVEWSGMPIVAQKTYRLKHVATGKYLVMGSSRELQGTLFGMTLSTSNVKEAPLQVTDEFNTKTSLWVLHPMDSTILNGMVLPIHCLVHCQNMEDKTWISAASAVRAQEFWIENPATMDRQESRDAVSARERMEREVLECAPVDPSVVNLLRTIGSMMAQLNVMVSELAVLPEIPLLGEAPSEKSPPESMDLLQLLMNEIAGSEIWQKVRQYSAPIQRILRSMSDLVLTNDMSPLPQHVKQALLLEQGVIRVAVRLLQTIFLEKKVPLWVLSLSAYLRDSNSRVSFQAQHAGFPPRVSASVPYSLQSYLPDSYLLTDLARTCSIFLRVACKGCPPTQKYLGSRCLKILHYLMGNGITMSKTLTAVYEDNLEILQNVTNEEIEDVFRKLKESQDEIYIRLLTTICTNRGQPLPETQNRIMDCLMRQRSVLPPVHVTVMPDGGPGRTVSVSYERQGSLVQVDCRQFTAYDGDTGPKLRGPYKSKAERVYLAVLATMDLLSTLSLGRNGHCQEVILRALELDNGQHCLQFNNLVYVVFSEELPPSLRQVCCKLLKNLYIDCRPHQEKKCIERMRIWLIQPEVPERTGPLVPGGTGPGVPGGYVRGSSRRASVSMPLKEAQISFLIPYIVQYIKHNGDDRSQRVSMEMRMETKPERSAVKLDIAVVQLLQTLLLLGIFPPLGTKESLAPRLVDALVPYLEKSVAVLYELGCLSEPGMPAHGQSAHGREGISRSGSAMRERRLTGDLPDSQATIMVVLESLTEVCRVLELFMEFRDNWQLSQAFQAFQDIHCDNPQAEPNGPDLVIGANWLRCHRHQEALEVTGQRTGPQAFERSPTSVPFPGFQSEEPAAVYKGHNFGPLQARIFGTPLLGKAAVGTDHVRPVPRLLAVLLQLTRFNYVPLQALAVGLVRKATGFKSQLLRNMLKLEILFLPEEMQVHERIIRELRELHCLCNSVRVRQPGRVGQTPMGPLRDVQQKIVAILDYFSGLCAVSPAASGTFAATPGGAPDWAGIPGMDLGPAGIDKAGPGLAACYSAHQVERHQIMLRLLDVHLYVVEILRIPQLTRVEGGVDLADSSSTPENGAAAWASGAGSSKANVGSQHENALWKTIIDSIFIFIHRFCLGIPAHQLLIVPHLSTILFYLNDMALHAEWAVEAVIKGNYQLCSDMDLVGSIVSATFDTILHRGHRVGLIKLLQALVAVDRVDGHETVKVPIRSSQILVMQQLFKYEKNVPELFTGTKGWASRHRLLLTISSYLHSARQWGGNPAALAKKEREMDEAAQALHYHIECVQLIAMCCIANHQAITQAAGLLTFDEIMTVLRALGTGILSTAQPQALPQRGSMSRTKTLEDVPSAARGVAGGGSGGFGDLFAGALTANTITVHPLVAHAVKAPYAQLLNHAYMRNSQEQAVHAVRSASSRIWPSKATAEAALLSPSKGRPASVAPTRGSPTVAREGVQGGSGIRALEQESVSLIESITVAVEAAIAELGIITTRSRRLSSATYEGEVNPSGRGTDAQVNVAGLVAEPTGPSHGNNFQQVSNALHAPTPPIPPAHEPTSSPRQGATIDTVFQGIQHEIDRVRGPPSSAGSARSPTGLQPRISADSARPLKVFGQGLTSTGSLGVGQQPKPARWKQPSSLRIFGQKLEMPQGISAASTGGNAGAGTSMPTADNAGPQQSLWSRKLPGGPITGTMSEMHRLDTRRSGASDLSDMASPHTPLAGAGPSGDLASPSGLLRSLQERGRQLSMVAREDEQKLWTGVTMSATNFVLTSALPLLTSYFRRHFKGMGDLLDIQEMELRVLASAVNQLMGAVSPQQQVQGLRFLEQLRTCGFDLSQLEGGQRFGLLMRPLLTPLAVSSDKVQVEIMQRRWLRFCQAFASNFHGASSSLAFQVQDAANVVESQTDTLNLAALLSSNDVVVTSSVPLPMPLVVKQLARFLPAFSMAREEAEGPAAHRAHVWEHKDVIVKVLRALRATLYLTEAMGVSAGSSASDLGHWHAVGDEQAVLKVTVGRAAARMEKAGRRNLYTLGGVVGEFMHMERQFEALVLGAGKAAVARQAARWAAFLEGRPLQEAVGDDGVLEWVQCKYNRLGVTICAAQLASHEDYHIHNEAVLLLICLLETGCREVQETLLAFLKQEAKFFDKLKHVLQTAVADSDVYRRTMKNTWRQMAAMRIAVEARQEEMHTSEGGAFAGEAAREGGALSSLSPMLGSPMYHTMITSPLFDGTFDNTLTSHASSARGSIRAGSSSERGSAATSLRSTPHLSPRLPVSRSARQVSFTGRLRSSRTKIAMVAETAAHLARSESEGATAAHDPANPPAASGDTTASVPANVAAPTGRESLDEITPLVNVSPSAHSARMLDAAAEMAAAMSSGPTSANIPGSGWSPQDGEACSSRTLLEDRNRGEGGVEWRSMDAALGAKAPEAGNMSVVAAGRQKAIRKLRSSSFGGTDGTLPAAAGPSDTPSLASPSFHRHHTSDSMRPLSQEDNPLVEPVSSKFTSLRIKTRSGSVSSYLTSHGRTQAGSPSCSPRRSTAPHFGWPARRERGSSRGSRQSDGLTPLSFYHELRAQALTDEEAAFNMAMRATTLESGHFVNVMRLLQLMCEGQKAEMQQLMRIQPDNVNSYDVIGQTILFLECLQPMLLDSINGGDATIILIIIQIFHFIYEVIQGPCFENQLAVVRSSLLRVSTHIFMSLDYALPSPAPAATARSSIAASTGSFTLSMGWKGWQKPTSPRRQTLTQNDYLGSWSVAGTPPSGAATPDHQQRQQHQHQHGQQREQAPAQSTLQASDPPTQDSVVPGVESAESGVSKPPHSQPWPRRASHSATMPRESVQYRRQRSLDPSDMPGRSTSAPVLESLLRHNGAAADFYTTKPHLRPGRASQGQGQVCAVSVATFNDLRCELKVAILDLYLGLLDELGDNMEIPDKMADVLDFRALLRNTLRGMALLHDHKRDEVQRHIWASFSKKTRKVLLLEEALKGLLLTKKLDDRISAQMPSIPRQGGFTGTGSLHSQANASHAHPHVKLRSVAKGHEVRQCMWHTGCGKPQFVGTHCLEHAISHDPELSQFLNANTSFVEILRNNKIERALFVLPHISKLIAADRKLQVATVTALQDVPRDNPKEKMQCFLGKLKLWLFKIRLAKGTKGTNKKSTRPLWYLLEYRSLISRTPFYISLLIFLLVTIWYGADSDSWRKNVVAWAFVKALGILQILVGFVCVLLFLMSESPLLLYKSQHKRGSKDFGTSAGNDNGSSSSSLRPWFSRRWRRDNDERGREDKFSREVARESGQQGLAASSEKRMAALNDSDMPTNLQEGGAPLVAQADDPSRLLPAAPTGSARSLRNWDVVRVLLLSPHFWYTCVMLIASFLGVLVSPFFFAVHLVDFIIYNPSGSIVLESVIVGGPLLLKTALVGVLVIFLFSIVTFVAYNRNHDSCGTFYQCMGLHMVYGLMPEVVIGTVIDPDSWQYVPTTITREPVHQTQTLFLLTFYIIWMFLLSNVITGQIVDAFGYIRLKKATMAKDLNERCFICSMERHCFGQHPDAFKEHIERDHNPLSYLYFVDYVSSKDPTECTGLENYVLQCVKADSVDWIPVARSLTLERLKHAGSLAGTENATASSGADTVGQKGSTERLALSGRHGLDVWGESLLNRHDPHQYAANDSLRQQLEEIKGALAGKEKQIHGVVESVEQLRAKLAAMEQAAKSKLPGSNTQDKAPAAAGTGHVASSTVPVAEPSSPAHVAAASSTAHVAAASSTAHVAAPSSTSSPRTTLSAGWGREPHLKLWAK